MSKKKNTFLIRIDADVKERLDIRRHATSGNRPLSYSGAIHSMVVDADLHDRVELCSNLLEGAVSGGWKWTYSINKLNKYSKPNSGDNVNHI